MKGKVKWYDINKGYGFIQGDDGNLFLLIGQIYPILKFILKRVI